MRYRGTRIIGNAVCTMIGALLFGLLCTLFIGSFYGVTGSLAFALVGAVVCIMIKRALTSDFVG